MNRIEWRTRCGSDTNRRRTYTEWHAVSSAMVRRAAVDWPDDTGAAHAGAFRRRRRALATECPVVVHDDAAGGISVDGVGVYEIRPRDPTDDRGDTRRAALCRQAALQQGDLRFW